jgi:uncharacterized protein YjiS (DUF1127 family)
MTATPLSQPHARWFRAPFLCAARRRFARWLKRRRQRVDLAELDDHLPADIGRTREEIRRECAVPFWR